MTTEGKELDRPWSNFPDKSNLTTSRSSYGVHRTSEVLG